MKIIARPLRPLGRLWLTLPPLVALATTSGIATAREGNVFGLTLSEALQYDTNLFRVAPETDNRAVLGSDRRDDFVSATTVLLDVNKPVGRHVFYGQWSQTYVRYQEFKRLNHNTDDDRVGWRGVFSADNRWDMYYSHYSTQSDFADLHSNFSNVVTTDTLSGMLSVRVAQDWQFRPELRQEDYSNSAVERQNNDGRARMLGLNLGYRPYTGNVIEGQYRHVARDYDVGGGFTQNKLGIYGSWAASGASVLDGRIARLQQSARNDGSSGSSNFHQVVGFVNYRWQPTGASVFNFRLFREISTINIGTDQEAVARGGAARWTWAPLAKVKFDTIFDYRKRNFPQAQVIDPASPGTRIGVKDRTHFVSLGMSYMPLQALTLQATARAETRHAEPSNRGYEDRIYSLVAQYAF